MARAYVPRWPTSIAVAYKRAIAGFVMLWERETIATLVSPQFATLTQQQARARGLDAELEDAPEDELDIMLDRTFAHIEQLQPDRDLASEALTRARDVDSFTRGQVERQLAAAAGRAMAAPAQHGDQLVAGFVSDNVALIKGMRRQARDSIEEIVRRGWRSGATAEQLAAQIRKRYGFMRKSRAELIAADQIGKLNGELTRARLLGAGVEQGRWRDRKDSRVREKHAELGKGLGTLFDLRVGVPVERFPGWPIRCRCWTEPVLAASDRSR